MQPTRANCTNLDFTCYSEIAYNFVSYAMHHAAMLYHDEGSAFFYTHDNAVLQPPFLRDPHGWWWDYLAAWATSGENKDASAVICFLFCNITLTPSFTEFDIYMARNTAIGLNTTSIAQGDLNLTVINSTLLTWGSAWPPAVQAIVNASGVRPVA